MNKETITLITALVAALCSLVISYFNLRSAKKLEKDRRSFELVKRDLDKLENFVVELQNVNLPRISRVEETESLDHEERVNIHQIDYEKINPIFIKISGDLLKYRSIFDEPVRTQIMTNFTKVDQHLGLEAAEARKNFTAWAFQIVEEQIIKTRLSWKEGV